MTISIPPRRRRVDNRGRSLFAAMSEEFAELSMVELLQLKNAFASGADYDDISSRLQGVFDRVAEKTKD